MWGPYGMAESRKLIPNSRVRQAGFTNHIQRNRLANCVELRKLIANLTPVIND